MQHSEAKVDCAETPALNPTSTSVSLITPKKINTAGTKLMAPACIGGAFPGKYGNCVNIQVVLLRDHPNVANMGVDFTGRDGGNDEEVLNHLCGRLTSGSLKLLCKKTGGHGKR